MNRSLFFIKRHNNVTVSDKTGKKLRCQTVYTEVITQTPAFWGCFSLTSEFELPCFIVKGVPSFVNTRSHSGIDVRPVTPFLLDNHTRRLLVLLLWLVCKFLLECRTPVFWVDWVFEICHFLVISSLCFSLLIRRLTLLCVSFNIGPFIFFFILFFFLLFDYAIIKEIHTCLAQNSLAENSTGDVTTIDQWDSE